MPEPRRGLAGRLLLGVAATAIAVTLLEVGARWLAPGPGLRERLARDTLAVRPRGPFVRIGPHSFRDRSLGPDDFAADTRRVLLLGDSFTEGWGIARSEDRFSGRLEHALGDDGLPVRIFNAGRSGTEPERWLGYLDALLPAVRPDLVVAVFFLRDGAPLPTALRTNRAWAEELYDAWAWVPLQRHSRFVGALVDAAVHRDFDRAFRAALRAAYLGSREETTYWRRQQEALRAIRAASERAGAGFLLVVFPLLLELDPYPFAAIDAEVERFARASRMAVFSLTPAFEGRAAPGLWVAPHDPHPNETGHAIAAEAMAPVLAEQLRAAGP